MAAEQMGLFSDPNATESTSPPEEDVSVRIARAADARPVVSAAAERLDKTAERKARGYTEETVPDERKKAWELQAAKSKAEMPNATEEDVTHFRELLYGTDATGVGEVEFTESGVPKAIHEGNLALRKQMADTASPAERISEHQQERYSQDPSEWHTDLPAPTEELFAGLDIDQKLGLPPAEEQRALPAAKSNRPLGLPVPKQQ